MVMGDKGVTTFQSKAGKSYSRRAVTLQDWPENVKEQLADSMECNVLNADGSPYAGPLELRQTYTFMVRRQEAFNDRLTIDVCLIPAEQIAKENSDEAARILAAFPRPEKASK